MRLLIIGATGPTGQQLIKQALEEGHTITAIARHPGAIKIQDNQLSVVKLDILNGEAMTKAITGHDAVLSTLGSGKDLRSEIVSLAMIVLIPAMMRANVKRLIFLSSFGVGETRKDAPFLSRIFFALVLRHILHDKEIADENLKHSELDYTLVYPTRLTNGKYTGNYRVGEKLVLKGVPRISRADVADFMLSQLTTARWNRRTAIISY